MDEHYILDQYHPESQFCISTVQELSVIPYKGNILIDRARKTPPHNEKPTGPRGYNTLPPNQDQINRPQENTQPQTNKEYHDSTSDQQNPYGSTNNEYYQKEKCHDTPKEPQNSLENKSTYVLPMQFSNPEHLPVFQKVIPKEDNLRRISLDMTQRENTDVRNSPSPRYFPNRSFGTHYNMTNKQTFKHWQMNFNRDQNQQDKKYAQNIETDKDEVVPNKEKHQENLTKPKMKRDSSKGRTARDSHKTEDPRGKESTINTTFYEDIEEEKNRIDEYLSSPDSQNGVQLPCKIEERIRQWLQKKKKKLELKTILKARPDYNRTPESQTSITTTIGRQYQPQRAPLQTKSKGTYAKITFTDPPNSASFTPTDHNRMISGDLMRLMIRKAEQRRIAKARLMERKQKFPLRSPYITFTEKFKVLPNTPTLSSLKQRTSTLSSIKTVKSILKKGNDPSTQFLSANGSKTKTILETVYSSGTSSDGCQSVSSRSKTTVKSKSSDVVTVVQKLLQYRKAKHEAERLEKEIYKSIK